MYFSRKKSYVISFSTLLFIINKRPETLKKFFIKKNQKKILKKSVHSQDSNLKKELKCFLYIIGINFFCIIITLN